MEKQEYIRFLNNEVSKIIKVFYKDGIDDDWDIIIQSNELCNGGFLQAIRTLIITEKDKMIFDVGAYSYLSKRIYFDTYYNFNDTLNNLKKHTVALILLLNNRDDE